MTILPKSITRPPEFILILAAMFVIGIIISPGCGDKSARKSSGPDFTAQFQKLSPDIPVGQSLAFAPGVISRDSGSIWGTTISPDGKEILWAAFSDSLYRYQLMSVDYDSSGWSQPKVVSYSGVYDDIRPAYSPDGRAVYFASQRPRPGDAIPSPQYHIWKATRQGDSWAEPEYLSINSDSLDWSPSVTRAGHLYFVSGRDGRRGDIFRAENFNSGLITPVSLSEPINSIWAESDIFVDPDEDFILFAAADRQKGYGGLDIYISWKSKDKWSEPSLLDARVNSPMNEICPFVSPDNRYLFFQRDKLYWFSLDSLGILE